MRTHFDGLRTKTLLMTFYDFSIRRFKKTFKKSCFLKSEKNVKYVFSNTGAKRSISALGRHFCAPRRYLLTYRQRRSGGAGRYNVCGKKQTDEVSRQRTDLTHVTS